jgi:hypothetical protein
MSQHGSAARADDPADGLGKPRPPMRDVAGLAAHQVSLEHLLDVTAGADLHEIPRKVTARDQLRIADVLERALVRAGNAATGQSVGHLASPGFPASADTRQSCDQVCILRIDAQSDHVDRLVRPAHGDLHARDEAQAEP